MLFKEKKKKKKKKAWKPSVEDSNDMKGAFAAQAEDGAYEKRTLPWVLLTYGTYSVTGGEWWQSENTEKLSWMSATPSRSLPVSLLHVPTPLQIRHYVHTFAHYMGSGFIMRLAFSVNVLITTGVPHCIMCTCLEKRDREWEHFHLAKSDTNLCQSSEPYFGAYSCNCYLLVCFFSLHAALFYILRSA